MRYILILLTLAYSFNLIAKVEFIWTGIAGVYLSDGKNSVFIDPVFSRPNILQILFGTSFNIDEQIVINELKKLKINKVDGIFIGHSHCDHAMDMHIVQKFAGGTIYGSQTTSYLALAKSVSKENIEIMKNNESYTFGDFTVTPLATEHGKIMDFWEFQGGELKAPLDGLPKLSDYRMGGSFGFYVSHPDGNFLVQQSSRTTKNIAEFIKGKKLKVVFQGLANRRNSKELYEGIINYADSVDYIVPIHHDNFFFEKNPKKVDLLWGLDLDEFLEYSKNQKPKVLMPEYDKRYAL